jgi:hypothetical protein
MRPIPYDRRDYRDRRGGLFAVGRWLEYLPLGKAMMRIADLAINGNYLAYLYVVLLQISILYLQRPNLNRSLREKDGTPSASPDFYSIATGFIATGLNWLSWLLSAYVAQEFGIANGVLFFILGMGSSIIANIFIPRLPRVDQVGHIISIPATILLVRAVLRAVGIHTGI